MISKNLSLNIYINNKQIYCIYKNILYIIMKDITVIININYISFDFPFKKSTIKIIKILY